MFIFDYHPDLVVRKKHGRMRARHNLGYLTYQQTRREKGSRAQIKRTFRDAYMTWVGNRWAQIRKNTPQEVLWNILYSFMFDNKVGKNESKVQSGHRGSCEKALQEAQTGFHAWNDLAFGVTQKVECFAVGIIRISEFSPESFETLVVVFITNAIPQRIVFPNFLDFLHKLRVFFPSLRMEDLKDGKGNDFFAARTSEGLTLLSALVGTGGMTTLTTTPQRGMIGDRCQTDHTFPGLGHQAKGSKRGLVKR